MLLQRRVDKLEPLHWINGRMRPCEMKVNVLNCNKMTKEEFENLKESIRRFNYAAPILLNVDATVVAGHHRREALIELGRGEEFIDIRTSSRPLTDDELQEYALRDNQTGSLDKDLLLKNFDKKKLLNWGFQEKDLKAKGGKFSFRPGEANPVLREDEQQTFEAFMSPWRDGIDVREQLSWVKNVVLDFSGGKDSSLTAYWFRKVMPHIKVYGGYCDIGVEIPSIGRHVIDLAEFLEVELVILKAETNWWKFMQKQGWPSMIFRQCQTVFLHKPLHDFKHKFSPKDTIVSDGGRKSQGVRGSKKTQFSEQGSTPGYQCFRPAFYLLEGTEVELMKSTGMPVWEGYDLGFNRTACWCCPGMCHRQAVALDKHYPGLCNEIRKLEQRYGKIRPLNDKSFDDILYGKGKLPDGSIDGDYESGVSSDYSQSSIETKPALQRIQESDDLPF